MLGSRSRMSHQRRFSRGENVVQSKFDDEACNKGEDPEGEVARMTSPRAPRCGFTSSNYEGSENDTHCAEGS